MTPTRPAGSPRPLPPLAVLLPLLLVLIAWSLAFPVQAGERRARLTLELSVEGGSQWRDGPETSSMKLSRRYKLVTYLHADGDPMTVNPKAPDYAQKMMARSAQVQARVAELQARRPQAAAPSQAALMAQAAQMQQLQASCRGDRDCLMRALMPQVAARASSDPALQARMVREAGQRQAGGHEADDAEEEARYLLFSGVDRCDGRLEVRADESSEGRYADVQGMVPWREQRSVSGGLSADEMRLMCLNFSLVLDTRTQAMTSDAGFGFPEPHTITTRADRGRTERSEGRLATLATVAQWVAERTRQAPRSGSAMATLPLVEPGQRGRGQSEGTVQVRLSWKLEDL